MNYEITAGQLLILPRLSVPSHSSCPTKHPALSFWKDWWKKRGNAANLSLEQLPSGEKHRVGKREGLRCLIHWFPAGTGDGGSYGSSAPGLPPGKEHPEDAQGCQHQPLYSQRWSWDSWHCSVGTSQWPFQGAVTEGDLENKSHCQCGDTGASYAHSPPQAPAPDRLRTCPCSPADTRCIIPALSSRETCKKPVPQGPHKTSMP